MANFWIWIQSPRNGAVTFNAALAGDLHSHPEKIEHKYLLKYTILLDCLAPTEAQIPQVSRPNKTKTYTDNQHTTAQSQSNKSCIFPLPVPLPPPHIIS